MKKVLLLVLVIAFSKTGLHAQIANASFESWTTILYSNPTGWQSGNEDAARFQGTAPVREVSGITGSALRLETIVYGSDTAQAFIANGDPGRGEGGIPCTGLPSAITGYYRYNIPGNDTGLIIVMFKNSGAITGMNVFKIKGTGVQNTFTQFSFPVSSSVTPDSVIIGITCSNLIDNIGVTAGSFMEIDALSFTGANVTIPNGNFETWTTSAMNLVSGWQTNGDVQKTSTSEDGNYAIQLTTVDYGNGDIGSGEITNGHYTENNGPAGGIPYTQLSDTMTGYYMYYNSGTDTANIYLSATANGSAVGAGFYSFAPASQYTYFEIPVSCSSMPDSLQINASSSKWAVLAGICRQRTYLDNLALKSELTAGVKTVEHKNPFSTFAYPNPSSEMISIHLEEALHGQATLIVYDASGHEVKNQIINNAGNSIQLNISQLRNGSYFYTVLCGSTVLRSSFTKN